MCLGKSPQSGLTPLKQVICHVPISLSSLLPAVVLLCLIPLVYIKFGLSHCTVVSRKANTIYPWAQLMAAHYIFEECLKVIIRGCLHLQMLNTLQKSFGLARLKHNPETLG